MRKRILAAALVLTACGPLFSNMPNPRDDAELRQTLLSLDPVAPGHVRTREGNYDLGEPNSDRALFAAWARRYLNADDARKSNLDYQPIPLPSSVKEAIELERGWQADAERKSQARRKELEAERAERERREETSRLKWEAKQQHNAAIWEQIAAVRNQRAGIREAAFAACNKQRMVAIASAKTLDNDELYRSFQCEEKRDADFFADDPIVSNLYDQRR